MDMSLKNKKLIKYMSCNKLYYIKKIITEIITTVISIFNIVCRYIISLISKYCVVPIG